MKTTKQSEEKKILTLNLRGKKEVNILERRYYLMKDAIMSIMLKSGSMTMAELDKRVKTKLGSKFDRKVGWYFIAIKLDLEARGKIERIPNKTPQRIRVK